MLQVGGVFDFKFLKVHAAYADQNNISVGQTRTWRHRPTRCAAGFIPVGIGNYNNQAYMVGLTVPLFGGSIFGSYQWADAKNIIIADLAPSSSPTTTSGVSATRIRSRAGPTCMSPTASVSGMAASLDDAAGGGILANASQIVDREAIPARYPSPVLNRATTQYQRPLLAAAFFSPVRPENPDYASAAINLAARCRSISPMRSLRSMRSLAVRACSHARARSR